MKTCLSLALASLSAAPIAPIVTPAKLSVASVQLPALNPGPLALTSGLALSAPSSDDSGAARRAAPEELRAVAADPKGFDGVKTGGELAATPAAAAHDTWGFDVMSVLVIERKPNGIVLKVQVSKSSSLAIRFDGAQVFAAAQAFRKPARPEAALTPAEIAALRAGLLRILGGDVLPEDRQLLQELFENLPRA